MIQKISFTSSYKIIRSKEGSFNRHPRALTTSIASDSLDYIKNGDKISISKKDNSYYIQAPDYLDNNIEKFCTYEGIEYIKE